MTQSDLTCVSCRYCRYFRDDGCHVDPTRVDRAADDLACRLHKAVPPPPPPPGPSLSSRVARVWGGLKSWARDSVVSRDSAESLLREAEFYQESLGKFADRGALEKAAYLYELVVERSPDSAQAKKAEWKMVQIRKRLGRQE